MRIFNVLMYIILVSVCTVVSVAQEDKIYLPISIGDNRILVFDESYGNRESARCLKETVQIQERVSVGKVAGESIAITEQEDEVVVRDEETLKRIRAGIKHNYPVKGMTVDEAAEAMGDPKNKKIAGNKQQWVYECLNDDGFYYDCFVLRFQDEILIKFLDLQ